MAVRVTIGDRVRTPSGEEGVVVDMRRPLVRSGFSDWSTGRRPEPPRWNVVVRFEDGRQWHYWASQLEVVTK